MKKSLFTIISLLLTAVLLLSACKNGGNEPTAESVTTPHDNEEFYSVAILQYDNDYTSNAMREAFIARMRTLGYDEAKMKFDILSAHAEADTLTEQAQSLKGSDFRLIVAVGTLAAKAVAEIQTETPCVFIGANDPVSSGLTTSLEIPDKNMTGSAFRSSAETLLSVMRVYTPDITNIALICPESDSAEAEAVRETLSENAYTVKIYRLSSTDAILSKISEISEITDAFYFPDEAYSDDAVSKIMELADEEQKIVFTSDEGFISAGALLGAFTDSKTLGEQAALCCDRLLQGETLSDIPVDIDVPISLFVNRQAAEAYQVEIPKSDNLVLM